MSTPPHAESGPLVRRLALVLAASLLSTLRVSHRDPTLWTQHHITNNDVEVTVTTAAISADGQSLAYTTASGLFLRDMSASTGGIDSPASGLFNNC